MNETPTGVQTLESMIMIFERYKTKIRNSLQEINEKYMSGHKPVANARLGQNQFGISGVVFELLAKLADINAQIFHLAAF